MEKFIYTFNEESRDALLAQNYSLIKSDETKKIYVFENKTDMCFALNKAEFVFSNTLTF